jgi:ribonuclease HII
MKLIKKLRNDEDLILGIDEAGRGPVIGDMFVVGVMAKKEDIPLLKSLGVRDSKKLTPKRRCYLTPLIIQLSEMILVVRYTPQDIDSENLTYLFTKSIIKIIRHAMSRNSHLIKEIYVDAISSIKVRHILSKELPDHVKLIYEQKADVKYVIVGAASIIAKYLRDKYVEYLRKIYGDFGSGYPSDPKTLSWLRRFTGEELPPIVRRTWKTLERVGISAKDKRRGWQGLLGYTNQKRLRDPTAK